MPRSSTTFKIGNQAAVKHGARSPSLRAQNRAALAQSLREQVQTLLPKVAAQDALLVDLLIDCLADVRQLRDYLNLQGGPVSGTGRLYKPLEMLRAREHDAVALMRELGVGVKARARFGVDVGTFDERSWMEARRRRAALPSVNAS